MAEFFPPEADAVAVAVEQMIAEDGPLTEGQIEQRLRAAGRLPDPRAGFSLVDVLDQVVQQTMPLCDDRWVATPRLLDGRILTHRIGKAELAADVLRLDADLAPLAILLEQEEYRRLADGTQVYEILLPSDEQLLVRRGAPPDAFGDRALLLEPGRFATLAVSAGDLIGLRLTSHGLALTAVAQAEVVPSSGRFPDLLEEIFAEKPHEPRLYDQVVWTACANDSELLRDPGEPLGEVIADLGYVLDVDWLAPPGFDFPSWRTDNRIRLAVERYDLDEHEAYAVVAVVGLYERIAELFAAAVEAERNGDADQVAKVLAEIDTASAGASRSAETGARPVTMRASLELLAEPAVAFAVLGETEDRGPAGPSSLGLFAETLEPLAPRSARAALRWLRAKAYEQLGATTDAETTLVAAERLDPSWAPTLYDLARYAADRGDAERGLSLLRRAEAPADEELVEVLERFRASPRSDLGRNDRCWCGSGRKYKQCHLHREQLPLEERAAWLYQKACMSLRSARARNLLIDLADRRARYDDSEDALLDALEDPLVTDAALFEGGILMDFVAARGELLPEDERALAEQWLLTERSVHEVDDVRPGEGLGVRDLRTGAVQYVREVSTGQYLEPGDLVCARVVPAGATMQILGGLQTVPLHRRDELIALLDSDPDPHELIEFLTCPAPL